MQMQTFSARDLLNMFVPADLFSPGRLDRDLVADFFMLFARAEFALKDAGFVRGLGKKKDEPSVDWNRFARALGSKLTSPDDPRIQEAVRFLQEKPPKKQVYRDRQLKWEPRECTNFTDPEFVIRSITTVRNNLFHGGKEIVGLMAERDRELVQNSLVVLAYCMTLNERVLRALNDLPPESAVA
jgi:hypothetical protein